MCICENCSNIHDGNYASGRFCSSVCSRKFSSNKSRKETNKKIAIALTGKITSNETKEKISNSWIGVSDRESFKAKQRNRIYKSNSVNFKGIKVIKKCKICKIEKEILVFGCICNECKKSYYENYRKFSKFQFNVYDYPGYFDLSLVESFGWYKPSNGGNNLNGVSRDHLYSVKDGFLNNVPLEIIKHPANCKLVKHIDNQKKGSKSSISLEELKMRIEFFNKLFIVNF